LKKARGEGKDCRGEEGNFKMAASQSWSRKGGGGGGGKWVFIFQMHFGESHNGWGGSSRRRGSLGEGGGKSRGGGGAKKEIYRVRAHIVRVASTA